MNLWILAAFTIIIWLTANLRITTKTSGGPRERSRTREYGWLVSIPLVTLLVAWAANTL